MPRPLIHAEPRFRSQLQWTTAPYAKPATYQIAQGGGWEWAVRRHKGKRYFRIYRDGNLQPGQFIDMEQAKTQAEVLLLEKLADAARNFLSLGSSCGGN